MVDGLEDWKRSNTFLCERFNVYISKRACVFRRIMGRVLQKRPARSFTGCATCLRSFHRDSLRIILGTDSEAELFVRLKYFEKKYRMSSRKFFEIWRRDYRVGILDRVEWGVLCAIKNFRREGIF